MTFPELLLLALVGLAVGGLVGSVGVGGVVLVPLLTLAFGVDIRVAIATCLFAYVFTGIASSWLYARRGSIPWRPAAWLCGAAVPGAFAGAAAVDAAPGWLLMLLIVALMIGAGLNGLRRGPAGTQHRLPPPALAAIGAAVGFGSALTGTGGAVILLPILLACGMPALPAVGLGQAMQLPVSLFATARNLQAGSIDFALGGLIAVTLTAGIAAGVHAAHALPAARLRRAVACSLIGFGALILARLAFAG